MVVSLDKKAHFLLKRFFLLKKQNCCELKIQKYCYICNAAVFIETKMLKIYSGVLTEYAQMPGIYILGL